VQLTPLEFRILYLLAMNEGRVVPYSRLVEYAWGYYDEGNSSLLKTHLSHIRKKLGLPVTGPGSVKAVLGVGYSLARI
jgi:DNA-binding response OmpR family regulator